MNVVRRILAGYRHVLQKHTNVVQSVQTSILLGVGDFTSQKIFESSKPYDYIRTLRFSFMGLALGPGLMVWYKVLDRVAGHDKSLRTSLKKVALDQLVFAPVMMVVFMGTLNALEGKSYAEFQKNLSVNYTDILITNWQVWPAIQVLNFSLVPLQYRVLLVQVVAMGWNTYLAWKLHRHRVVVEDSPKDKKSKKEKQRKLTQY